VLTASTPSHAALAELQLPNVNNGQEGAAAAVASTFRPTPTPLEDAPATPLTAYCEPAAISDAITRLQRTDQDALGPVPALLAYYQ
jgi:hypothetical protein